MNVGDHGKEKTEYSEKSRARKTKANFSLTVRQNAVTMVTVIATAFKRASHMSPVVFPSASGCLFAGRRDATIESPLCVGRDRIQRYMCMWTVDSYVRGLGSTAV